MKRKCTRNEDRSISCNFYTGILETNEFADLILDGDELHVQDASHLNKVYRMSTKISPQLSMTKKISQEITLFDTETQYAVL